MRSYFIRAVTVVALSCVSEIKAQNSLEEVEVCVGNVQFIAIDDEVDFQTAVQRCEEKNALVAGIISSEENAAVASLTDQLSIPDEDDFWLGI